MWAVAIVIRIDIKLTSYTNLGHMFVQKQQHASAITRTSPLFSHPLEFTHQTQSVTGYCQENCNESRICHEQPSQLRWKMPSNWRRKSENVNERNVGDEDNGSQSVAAAAIPFPASFPATDDGSAAKNNASQAENTNARWWAREWEREGERERATKDDEECKDQRFSVSSRHVK